MRATNVNPASLGRLREGLDVVRHSVPCRVTIAVAVWLVLQASPAVAETLSGRIVAVADGDTLTLLDHYYVTHKIRLSGIDAPEKRQPFGQRAKEALSASAYGQKALADCVKTDRYGRSICLVRVGGHDIGLEQIRAGLAWWYRQYARDQGWLERFAYEQAEERARSARLGLWSANDPAPPWEWRHASKHH